MTMSLAPSNPLAPSTDPAASTPALTTSTMPAGLTGPAAPEPVDPRFLTPVPAAGETLDYHRLLRGPRLRWWRPLASLGLLLGMGTVVVVVVALVAAVAMVAALLLDVPVEGAGSDLALMVVGNVLLAALIPVVLLATRRAHGVRPGYVSSVTGRFRFRVAFESAALLLPVWVVGLAIGTWWLGLPVGTPMSVGLTIAYAAVTLPLTPLQAAGEEYLFRGWLAQQTGALVGHRVAALAASTLLPSALFALAHGSLDPWILADLALFGLVAAVLTWRTGGLEAAVALHTVHNVSVLCYALATGTLAQAFVAETSVGDPRTVALSLVMQVVGAALVLWRFRDARTFSAR